jgi:hypothetical protein
MQLNKVMRAFRHNQPVKIVYPDGHGVLTCRRSVETYAEVWYYDVLRVEAEAKPPVIYLRKEQ